MGVQQIMFPQLELRCKRVRFRVTSESHKKRMGNCPNADEILILHANSEMLRDKRTHGVVSFPRSVALGGLN